MDIKTMRSQPHLSASGISTYIECSLMYRFSRVDRMKPDYRGDALEFGSCVHRALAEFNQERMMGNILSPSELADLFEIYWLEAMDKEDEIKFGKGNTSQTLLNLGRNILEACHAELAGDNFNILAIEEPFQFNLDGIEEPIIGIMDLVCEDPNGTVVIVDYKTAKRGLSTDEINKNFQMGLYYMAAKANGYADREVLLRLDCLLKTKTPRFEQYYTSRSDLDETRMARKIRAVLESIQKGVFVPNDTSWKCVYCAYKSYCNAWFQGEIP